MNKKPVVKVERIHPLDTDGPTKAFCDLLLLDTFVIKGLKIVQGKNGIFLSMPQQQGKDGKWYSTFYPVSAEIKKGLEELVLEEYDQMLEETVS